MSGTDAIEAHQLPVMKLTFFTCIASNLFIQCIINRTIRIQESKSRYNPKCVAKVTIRSHTAESNFNLSNFNLVPNRRPT